MLRSSLHLDCDPEGPSGYAFLGMDAKTIQAVDENNRAGYGA